ncbi:MAG TPA: energy transducer TonB [Thermoanaerobaculia bacterium]|nr:energy transducer TonB [Thermoanaerobaculia bacterium]
MRASERRDRDSTRVVASVLPWIRAEEDQRRPRLLRLGLLGAALVHLVLLQLPFFEAAGRGPRILRIDPPPFRLAPTPAPRTPDPQPPPPNPPEPVAEPIRIPVPEAPVPEPIVRPIALPPVAVPSAPAPSDTVAIPDAPPPGDGIVEWSPEIERPVRLSGADPVFTECARRTRTQGVVVLEAVIGRDGSVRDVNVLRGLPCGLDLAATRAVSGWTFRPGRLDGRPLTVRYRLSVVFRLR